MRAVIARMSFGFVRRAGVARSIVQEHAVTLFESYRTARPRKNTQKLQAFEKIGESINVNTEKINLTVPQRIILMRTP